MGDIFYRIADYSRDYGRVCFKIYRDLRLDHTDWGIVDKDVFEELTFVQKNALPSFYRWYYNYPNYRGKHVITDESGFRIDTEKIDQRKKWVCLEALQHFLF